MPFLVHMLACYLHFMPFRWGNQDRELHIESFAFQHKCSIQLEAAPNTLQVCWLIEGREQRQDMPDSLNRILEDRLELLEWQLAHDTMLIDAQATHPHTRLLGYLLIFLAERP